MDFTIGYAEKNGYKYVLVSGSNDITGVGLSKQTLLNRRKSGEVVMTINQYKKYLIKNTLNHN